MGRKSKRKGAAYEQKVARLLREWSGQHFGRTKFSDGRGTDTADIQTPEGFRPVIECKKVEGWSWDSTLRLQGLVWAWWAQALRQAVAAPGRDERDAWLVFSRAHRPDWLMMRLELSRNLDAAHGDLTPAAVILSQRVAVYQLQDVLQVTDYEWFCQTLPR